MNVMRSFTLKSLKRNKKRTIVTIIGVIISTAMLTAVSVFFSSFVSLIQRDTIASDGNWHAAIQNVPTENVSAITSDTAIDKSFLMRDLGFAALEGTVNESKPYLYVQQYSEAGFNQMSVKLLSGRLPQASGEVLISETIENSAGVAYKIGDTLNLALGDRMTNAGEALTGNHNVNYIYNEDGTQRTLDDKLVQKSQSSFTVVGIMARPSFEKSWSAGCGVLGFIDAATLSPGNKVDVMIAMKSVSKDIYKTIPALALQAGAAESDVSFHDELLRYYGVVSYDNVLTFIYIFAAIIIAIIILASVSLIYNSFAISVSERSRQLGLLASVGATKRQKRASMYFEGFMIGLYGIPLGLLAGIGGMAITLRAIQPLLDGFFNVSEGMTLDLVVPLWSIGATIALAILTIFISVYMPARRASRITAIDAIRLSHDVKLTRRAVKTSRLTRALFGFEASIALKNLKRSRRRYRSTIISLVISVVLFLTVSMYANMTQRVYGSTVEGINFDIAVSYNAVSDAQRNGMNEDIASLDLVNSHTEQTNVGGFIKLNANQLTASAKTINGDAEENSLFNANLISLDDESFKNYADAVGVSKEALADTQTPKAILINYGQDYYTAGEGMMKIAGDVLNAKAGDTLSFCTDIENPESDMPLTVGAVTQERPMGTLIGGFYGVTLVVSEDVLKTITADLSTAPEMIVHNMYLSTSDDQRLEKQLNQILNTLPESSWYLFNIQSENRAQQSVGTFLGVFVYGFIILISLICIANIFNTVSTNIALRRREFAMMRSVGMTPGGFNRMIRFESIFYGLKALLFGLPISVAISYLLYKTQQGVLVSGFTLPWQSYGFAVLMLLVVVFSTMLYSTHRIKKENIIDALKDENL